MDFSRKTRRIFSTRTTSLLKYLLQQCSWRRFGTTFPYMADGSSFARVAFSPGEFAKLFGKSQTWGYRQIYGGKVKAITEHGRILIPAAEVDAILKTAGVYDGMKPKLGKSKEEIQKLAPSLQNAWQNFLAARRRSPAKTKTLGVATVPKAKWPAPSSGRQAALARLTRNPKSGEKAR